MADTALWFFDSPTPTSEGGSLKSIQDARGINWFSYLSKCKYLHKDSLAEYEMAYLGRDALCRVFVQHSAVSPRTKTVLLKHFKACPPTFGWMARWVTFCPQVRSAELCWAVLKFEAGWTLPFRCLCACQRSWRWTEAIVGLSACFSFSARRCALTCPHCLLCPVFEHMPVSSSRLSLFHFERLGSTLPGFEKEAMRGKRIKVKKEGTTVTSMIYLKETHKVFH